MGTLSSTTLLRDYPLPDGAALLTWHFAMLGDGGIAVRGQVAVELDQETYHCYVRCLGDRAAPGLADEVCTRLAAPRLGELDPWLLGAASAPLPPGTYDVLATTASWATVPHCGLRISAPAEYDGGFPDYVGDPWGVKLRSPHAWDHARGYGMDIHQPSARTLYRGEIGRALALLLPLTDALDDARVEHYAQVLRGGGCPTVVAAGFYTNDRTLVAVIVDGHHKLAAASRTGRPVGVLAFISCRLLDEYAQCWAQVGPLQHRVRENILDQKLPTSDPNELDRWYEEVERRLRGR